MKKNIIKQLIAWSVVSTAIFGSCAMSLTSVNAKDNSFIQPSLDTVKGTATGITIEQYILLKSTAHVPSCSFKYTITGGTAVAGEAGFTVYSGTPGATAATSAVEGTPIIGTKDTQGTYNLIFTPSDDTSKTSTNSTTSYTINGKTTTLNDYSTDLPAGYSYVKKNIPLDFSGVTFKEPGIYRYVITQTSMGPYQGTWGFAEGDSRYTPAYVKDSANTKYLDIYVEYVDSLLQITQSVLRNSLNDATTSKVPGFYSTFKTVDIDFTHLISGNQARASQYFEGVITMGDVPNGTKLDIEASSGVLTDGNTLGTYTFNVLENNSIATKGTLNFKLKAGEHYILKDVPIDEFVNFSEDETALSKSGYTATIDHAHTSGYLTDDWEIKDGHSYYLNDTRLPSADATTVKLAFDMHKDGTIPTGIILTVAPYATLAVAGFAGLLIFVRKKKKSDED